MLLVDKTSRTITIVYGPHSNSYFPPPFFMGAYKKDAHTTVWAFFCTYDSFIFYRKSIVFFIVETYFNRDILINIKNKRCFDLI